MPESNIEKSFKILIPDTKILEIYLLLTLRFEKMVKVAARTTCQSIYSGLAGIAKVDFMATNGV